MTVSVSFLTDDTVHPDDIENLARAVLDIRLPRSPDQIQSMIDEINNLLSNISRFQDDLKKLEEHTNITQELLRKAEEVKLVSEINTDRALYWSLLATKNASINGTKICHKNSLINLFFKTGPKSAAITPWLCCVFLAISFRVCLKYDVSYLQNIKSFIKWSFEEQRYQQQSRFDRESICSCVFAFPFTEIEPKISMRRRSEEIFTQQKELKIKQTMTWTQPAGTLIWPETKLQM